MSRNFFDDDIKLCVETSGKQKKFLNLIFFFDEVLQNLIIILEHYALGFGTDIVTFYLF